MRKSRKVSRRRSYPRKHSRKYKNRKATFSKRLARKRSRKRRKTSRIKRRRTRKTAVILPCNPFKQQISEIPVAISERLNNIQKEIKELAPILEKNNNFQQNIVQSFSNLLSRTRDNQ